MTNLWHTVYLVRSQDFGVGLVDKKLLGFAWPWCLEKVPNIFKWWCKMVITMVKSCKIRKTSPTKQIQGCQKLRSLREFWKIISRTEEIWRLFFPLISQLQKVYQTKIVQRIWLNYELYCTHQGCSVQSGNAFLKANDLRFCTRAKAKTSLTKR